MSKYLPLLAILALTSPQLRADAEKPAALVHRVIPAKSGAPAQSFTYTIDKTSPVSCIRIVADRPIKITEIRNGGKGPIDGVLISSERITTASSYDADIHSKKDGLSSTSFKCDAADAEAIVTFIASKEPITSAQVQAIKVDVNKALK